MPFKLAFLLPPSAVATKSCATTPLPEASSLGPLLSLCICSLLAACSAVFYLLDHSFSVCRYHHLYCLCPPPGSVPACSFPLLLISPNSVTLLPKAPFPPRSLSLPRFSNHLAVVSTQVTDRLCIVHMSKNSHPYCTLIP